GPAPTRPRLPPPPVGGGGGGRVWRGDACASTLPLPSRPPPYPPHKGEGKERAREYFCSMFSNTRITRVEWGDCDPAGIIFYVRYFDFFDVSTTMLLERALGMKKIA